MLGNKIQISGKKQVYPAKEEAEAPRNHKS